MRVECPAKVLLAAVRRAMPAISSNPRVNPILSCVLVRGTADAVTLSASDTETYIRVTVAGASCPEPGVVAIPAEQLATTLGEIGTDDVTLDTNAGFDGVRLAATAARFDMPTRPAAEFPEPAQAEDGGPWFELTPDAFRSLVRLTSFAADRKGGSGRFNLTAVLVERTGPRVQFVGTDTKRLAIATSGVVSSDGNGDTDPKKPHLVPVKVLEAAAKAADEIDSPIRVKLRPNQVTFELPGWSLYSHLIQGKFPPYADIISKLTGVAATVELDAAEFASAVRLAAVMTDMESRRIDFAFKPGTATLKTAGSKGGEGEVEHPCPGFNGPRTEVSLDPAYVLDWLKAVSGKVSLDLAGKDKPVVFRRGDDATYLVMSLSN